MKFSNLKIGTRLLISFVAVLSLLVVIACVGWKSLSLTKQRVEVIVNENDVKIASANEMLGALNVEERAIRNILLFSDPVVRTEQKKTIADARARYGRMRDRLASLLITDAAKKLLKNINASEIATSPELDKVVALADASKEREGAEYLLSSVRALQENWFAGIQAMIDLQEWQNDRSIEALNVEYKHTLVALFGVTLAAIILGVTAAWTVTRSITRPLNEAVGVAQRIAAGDLGMTIHSSSHDETGRMMRALQSMNGSLNQIVGEVRHGTDAIATASGQIASGNLDLSARTEQQASSLEETASAMEQLTATVRQNADHAQHASQLAVSASEVAISGGNVVGKVVDTMSAINQSSRKIVDIIRVIDDIAFQTNILALNASVEAARAGSQGRGFSVVATEVRALAQRSASAAKEIKVLIDNSVMQIDTGSQLVEQAGQTMNDIVNSVRQVSNIVEEISTASREQSTGIEQVNIAIAQMDQVTQQNAALVEEAAAAAGAMEDQAAKLSNVVGIFRLDANLAAPLRLAMA